ncbi:MAG: DNA-directed RNA polymerase subunit alpha [Synergistaceae bacterium]|nr:DNA-directed RNA polymerase subunit alpha [Synergistaceae bacterium]
MQHERQYEIAILDSSKTYGKVNIGPLEKGYGVTLGNSLRRVLLSSITGAAIVAVRIDGVVHEFSTIPGVKEDVIEILVNLKHIPVACEADEVQVLHLSATATDGAKEVTVADIEPNSEVEFQLDEDGETPYICTLEEGCSVNMDIYVAVGVGYDSIDRPRASYLPVDALQTDALYSPVKRVKYEVNPQRYGKKTDYDNLTMEIWTNGVVTPTDAIAEASSILRNYYIDIINAVAAGNEEKFAEDAEINTAEPLPTKGNFQITQQFPMGENSVYMKTVEELDLSVRSLNCLKKAGINFIHELVARSPEQLLRYRNLGRKSLVEIQEKIARYDLHLAGDSGVTGISYDTYLDEAKEED